MTTFKEENGASHLTYLEKPEGLMRFPDLMISLEDNDYKKWFFEFKSSRSSNISLIYNFYGRLLTLELKPTDKFTLVINDEKMFEHIIKIPPVNLRANLYIMLVDLENRTVIKEEQISKY